MKREQNEKKIGQKTNTKYNGEGRVEKRMMLH